MLLYHCLFLHLYLHTYFLLIFFKNQIGFLYIAADIWSRRIDLEHRLVYKVTENKVYFLQARYHYESD